MENIAETLFQGYWLFIMQFNTIVEFYARMVKDCECNYTNQLVYTSDNKVTAGFGKKLLLK